MDTYMLLCFQSILLTAESANQWVSYSTSLQYYLSTTCRPIAAAESYCTSIGGELASAQNESQRNFIVNTINDGSSGSGTCTPWASGTGVWMGGTLDDTTDPETILWYDGSRTGAWDNSNPIDWDDGEPNTFWQQTIGFLSENGKWHSVNMDDAGNMQICQRILTLSPSNSPTLTPSLSPTNIPSFSPTSDPSLTPTLFPTTSPSKSPINIPSMHPTDIPSKESTSNPTASPLDELNVDVSTTNSISTYMQGNDGKNTENQSMDEWIYIVIAFSVLCCCLIVILIAVYGHRKNNEKAIESQIIANEMDKENVLNIVMKASIDIPQDDNGVIGDNDIVTDNGLNTVELGNVITTDNGMNVETNNGLINERENNVSFINANTINDDTDGSDSANKLYENDDGLIPPTNGGTTKHGDIQTMGKHRNDNNSLQTPGNNL